MKTIKRSQVINIIKENENKIFSVIFIFCSKSSIIILKEKMKKYKTHNKI